MKLKKTKKVRKMRGTRLHGYAAKKHKGSGTRGGVGMAGTGKRGDQKKGMVTKMFGEYFGKKGHTSKGTKRDKSKIMNVGMIEKNLHTMIKKGTAKKEKEGIIINLKGYTILADGIIKEKVIINAKKVSKSAEQKIINAGGKVIVKESDEEKQ
ncbi:hypothetical protein COU61_00160 [Candidatus Pacearchaeota archaeon CG10_big_fil_rev_8_21_14_0_10_35_13]|nr:MAG: hypothetical protein COU61_00160 [Candidatus Pacearchaeota archaeon CG10_big_fil_rev_8_21_14_0_10_35_13]